jgi:hypothetical protein
MAPAFIPGLQESDKANRFIDAFQALAIDHHFASFGEGIVRFGDVVYFVGGAVVLLYLCSFLLGRRHW